MVALTGVLLFRTNAEQVSLRLCYCCIEALLCVKLELYFIPSLSSRFVRSSFAFLGSILVSRPSFICLYGAITRELHGMVQIIISYCHYISVEHRHLKFPYQVICPFVRLSYRYSLLQSLPQTRRSCHSKLSSPLSPTERVYSLAERHISTPIWQVIS